MKLSIQVLSNMYMLLILQSIEMSCKAGGYLLSGSSLLLSFHHLQQGLGYPDYPGYSRASLPFK